MSITTDHIEAVRAFFLDPDEHARRTDQLAQTNDLDGYWAMVAATLVALAGRRFIGVRRSSDAVRWVAAARARLLRTGQLHIRLHADSAEALLRIALGELESYDRLREVPGDVRGETQFLLLGLLYDDLGYPDLDDLLDEAHAAAVSRWH